jgi:hypothetical protein
MLVLDSNGQRPSQSVCEHPLWDLVLPAKFCCTGAGLKRKLCCCHSCAIARCRLPRRSDRGYFKQTRSQLAKTSDVALCVPLVFDAYCRVLSLRLIRDPVACDSLNLISVCNKIFRVQGGECHGEPKLYAVLMSRLLLIPSLSSSYACELSAPLNLL